MNIIELYSGSSNFSNEMRKRGHNVIDIDINPLTPALKHLDITNLNFKDLENMFSNHKVDFIFAAPDVFAYIGFSISREALLFKNILSKANCGYIVELISYPPKKAYRANLTQINLNYTKFKGTSNRVSHLVTNCTDLPKFLEAKLDLVDQIPDKEYFIDFRGETPHQLVILLADFIEKHNKGLD